MQTPYNPDKLLAAFNYLYLGAGALVFISTLAIAFFGTIVNRRKDSELRTHLAGADLRIAEANAQAAQAHSTASEANKLAQQAALDKAKIEQSNLVLQAQLNKERDARLAIERAIAPRLMTVSQMGQVWGIEGALGATPVDIVYYEDNPEVRSLAGNLSVALQHWSPSLYGLPSGIGHDVTIWYDPKIDKADERAQVILEALRRASSMQIKGPWGGLTRSLDGSVFGSYPDAPHDSIRIVVGYR